MDTIGIGLVGYGMIGKVHALAYHDIPVIYPSSLPHLKLAAICTTNERSAQSAAHDSNFEAWTTSIEELLSRGDVDVVDVCVPNFSHHEIILAALRAGKHVIVDKPLARTALEAEEIAKVATAGKARLGMVFNYRFVPALILAHKLIAAGALGAIYHFHLDYLHTGYQNPNRPMSWRLRHAQSGGGALVDLGSHIIDMARYLLGEFAEVHATTQTYILERPTSAKSSERERVDVDDVAWLHAKMESGARGTLFVTRYATGAVDDMNVHIYGERGALKFSLQDGNVLNYFNTEDKAATQGWTRIQTGSEFQGAVVPPPRSILGWNRTHTENIYRILHSLAHAEPIAPDVTDGLRVHQIIDSAYQSAASSLSVGSPR
jgi:predicted dehydrogenase